MFQIVEGDTRGLNDVDEFIDLINTRDRGGSDLFDAANDIFLTRAPGRLDVMGGIADYSGSLVLQMPTSEATCAAIQRTREQKITVISVGKKERQRLRFEISLLDLLDKHPDYGGSKKRFSDDPLNRWASYVCGAFPVLNGELGVTFPSGARILVASDVPIGKGVSSSAALEVAVMQAVCAAFDIAIEPRELALLCQKVENEIVGAPCGVMDQIASNCGRENELISLLCQPAEILGSIPISKDIELWGVDSGVRHAVAGSDYTSVRIGTSWATE